MAYVPAATAAVKANSPPSGKPNGMKPVDKKSGAEGNGTIGIAKGDKNTFSDVLKKVKKSGLKPSAKITGNRSMTKTPHKSRTPAMDLLAEARNTARITEPENLQIEESAAKAVINSLDTAQNQTASANLLNGQKTAGVKNSKSSRTARSAKSTKTTRAGIPAGVRSEKTSGNSESVRTADLTSSSPRVEVIDNRNHSPEAEIKNIANEPGDRGSRLVDNLSRKNLSAEPVRLDHNSAVAETDIEISNRGDGKTFQKSAAAELAQKLDAQAGNDIVRQVKVILNRADTGEVRINLRPDNLGQVKIRIRMENNRLTGRIFVESAAAREAFKNALDGLQTRLVESGFGAADLEMAWDESPRGFMRNGDQQQGQKGNVNEAIQEFDNIIPAVFADDSVESRVNMVI